MSNIKELLNGVDVEWKKLDDIVEFSEKINFEFVKDGAKGWKI